MTEKHGIRPVAEMDAAMRLIEPPRVNDHDVERHSVETMTGASVQPERVRWLWRHWLARGKISLLAGAPGTGKSTLAMSIAARVTTGGTMPDGETVDACDVLIWSGEDDIADTLLPRFLTACGDPNRIHFIKSVTERGERRPFDPAVDMVKLAEVAGRLPDLGLIVLDPIVSAVSGDSHKNTEARRGLQPVADLASATDSAMLGITHFSKGGAGREPHERVNGSIAFAALPRVVLATVKPADPAAPRRLVRAKSNLGPDTGGIEYTLFQAPVPGHGWHAQCVEWGALLEGTARELMEVEEPNDPAHPVDDAEAFLRDMLAAGPISTIDLKAAAAAHGLSWRTVNRAKVALGATAAKGDFRGGWSWRLPEECQPRAEGCHHE